MKFLSVVAAIFLFPFGLYAEEIPRKMKVNESILRNRLIYLDDPLKLQKDDPLKPKDPYPENEPF